ncbi:MAG: hypothetical protein AAF092_09950 [Pseudomonadota bacterium]
MKMAAAMISIPLSVSALAADPAADVRALCLAPPLDLQTLPEELVEAGWQPVEGAEVLDTLAADAVCSDATLDLALTRESYDRMIALDGKVLGQGDVTLIAADRRGGDILDRICIISAPADGTGPSSERINLNAYGWTGKQTITAATCANTTTHITRIRNQMRKNPN